MNYLLDSYKGWSSHSGVGTGACGWHKGNGRGYGTYSFDYRSDDGDGSGDGLGGSLGSDSGITWRGDCRYGMKWLKNETDVDDYRAT